jgi:SAM-dependent methyltransferase
MSQNREDIRSIYKDMLFGDDEKLTVPDNDPQLSFIRRYLPDSRQSKILDAGCGNGRYMHKLKDMGYGEVYGIDLFDSLKGFEDSYFCASIDAVPFPNENFDMVYSNSVIFYLDDPTEALKEYFRVLKKNGHVIITCHTKYSLFTLDRILKRKIEPELVKHLEGVRFYSSEVYRKMMQEVGFEVVEIDGYKLSYLLWPLLRKVLKLLKLYRPAKKRQSSKRNKIWGRVRSIFCYHAVLVGEKP